MCANSSFVIPMWRRVAARYSAASVFRTRRKSSYWSGVAGRNVSIPGPTAMRAYLDVSGKVYAEDRDFVRGDSDGTERRVAGRARGDRAVAVRRRGDGGAAARQGRLPEEGPRGCG